MCAWETVLRMEPVKRRVAQLIRKKKAKWADEPGSVVDDRRYRRPLARNPSAVRATPWRSYLRLLRRGLAKPPYRYDAGSLLHYRFSFSLTRLREQRESSFLRRFPSGHPARPLACLLPCGARTFLMTLARPAIVWPTSHTRLYQTAMMWGRIGTMFANKT